MEGRYLLPFHSVDAEVKEAEGGEGLPPLPAGGPEMQSAPEEAADLGSGIASGRQQQQQKLTVLSGKGIKQRFATN